jgi:hypothetical protein
MYLDQPGVYLTEQATPVSDDAARQAGFDTEKWAKARKRESALRAAMAEIDLTIDGPNAGNTVIAEKDGWQVIGVGLGNANVLDPDGHKLNAVPLSEAAAKILLSHMAA